MFFFIKITLKTKFVNFLFAVIGNEMCEIPKHLNHTTRLNFAFVSKCKFNNQERFNRGVWRFAAQFNKTVGQT